MSSTQPPPEFIVDLTSSESVIVISDTSETNIVAEQPQQEVEAAEVSESGSGDKRDVKVDAPAPRTKDAKDDDASERRESVEEGEIPADSDVDDISSDAKDEDTDAAASEETALDELRKQVLASMHQKMAKESEPVRVPPLRRKHSDSGDAERRRVTRSRARSIVNTRRATFSSAKRSANVSSSHHALSQSRKRKAVPTQSLEVFRTNLEKGMALDESENADLIRARLLASFTKKRRQKFEAVVSIFTRMS